jgi:hypothetical protein
VVVEYDSVLGTLSYDVRVSGAAAADVYGVVLRHTNEDGGSSVVARLTGPSVTMERGVITVDRALRGRLEAGSLVAVLVTRDAPWGTVSVPLRLSTR